MLIEPGAVVVAEALGKIFGELLNVLLRQARRMNLTGSRQSQLDRPGSAGGRCQTG